mgnify:CR=1 FL=1
METAPVLPWQLAPHPVPSPKTDIHVWRANLHQPDAVRSHLWETLTEAERSRALRYRQESVQQKWIVGRGVLRSLLSQYLGTAPAAIQFEYAPRGKPRLADPTQPNLVFNVTHSHELWLCAIAWDCELGIDIEHQRAIDQRQDIIQRYFAPLEQVPILAAPAPQQTAEFFRIWTLKEAICKATGEGIQAFGQTTLNCQTHPIQVLHINGHPPNQSWSLHSFHPAPAYSGAIAYNKPPRPLHYWLWPPQWATPD